MLLIIAIAIGLLTYFESQAMRRMITAVILPMLIVSTVLTPASPFGRLLEFKPVRFVGRLSYSLYIWQMMFLVPAPRPLGVVQDFPLALILPTMLAIFSYYLVEKPCIRFGHRWSRPASGGNNVGQQTVSSPESAA